MDSKIRNSFAKVVIDSSMNRTFDYSVPAGLRSRIQPGSQVRVSFRETEVTGTVVELPLKPEVQKLKPILDVVGEDPFLSGTGLELARWVSKYYCCRFASAFRSVNPLAIIKSNEVKKKRGGESLWGEETVLPAPVPECTPQQKKVLSQILPALEKDKFFPYLLFGVTGSGKTEVYLRSIEAVLKKGKKAIVVVPEISLTPQTVYRFRSRFTDAVAVWHSQLTPAQRRDQWNRIRKGEVSIVIGARSAIFSPIAPLGLIIVDEEHEKSYKQGETPRYHARDLAVMRGYLENSTVILGSATPALESFHNVKKEKYHLGILDQRVDDKPLPEVKVIDMKEVFKKQKGNPVFSSELLDAVSDRLRKKEQVILFLNRRGYSSFVLCRSCGHILKCKNCSVSLTYHQKNETGKCHLCGYGAKVQKNCPKCREGKLSLLGIGTQKIEKQIGKIFPEARVERLDSDTTAKRGHSERILRSFGEGKIDILIGTQMIAKGLDFPNVTLTGVVLADVTLHVPDFRSGEYTFQLLTQVAGRAGRGDVPGNVLIQTFTPKHPAIEAAKNHDFKAFYDYEMTFRKELDYPPFTHFLVVTVQGKKEEKVRESIGELKKQIEPDCRNKAEVLGPVQAPLARVKKNFRWQLVLKGEKVLQINRVLLPAVERIENRFPVQILVDVDPTIML